MTGIEGLIKGFASFREQYFEQNRALYRTLVKRGQSPKVAMVACSDSRVDPAIVLQAEPGDIFAIRNVANLVPPYDDQEGDVSYHGTSAALEFAVCQLGVEHVIVFGHAHCSGIEAAIAAEAGETIPGRYVSAWTSIAREADRRARAECPDAEPEAHARCCEKSAVVVSLENLMTFPFIKDRVDAGTLTLHGWYIDIAEGTLCAYDAKTKAFPPIEAGD